MTRGARLNLTSIGSAVLVINCQSDLLGQIDTRLVAPVVRRADAPAVALRLNPVFAMIGQDHVMVTQAAAAVPKAELGEVVASLAAHSFEIIGALNFLLGGF